MNFFLAMAANHGLRNKVKKCVYIKIKKIILQIA